MTSTKKRLKIALYAYQKRWVADDSRFKLAVKSVQIGWSWAEALSLALSLIEKRQTWLWMSGSQRQSREAAHYVKTHLAAMGAAAEFEENVEEFFGRSKALVDRVLLPNGARAFFLPANPDTARGFAGNVVLDEFASHENGKAIWAAMFGRVSRGYSLRVFSSPKGAQGKFFELAKRLGLDSGLRPDVQPVRAHGWSGHWCDANLAVAEGSPLKVEELREAMGDDELFAQEYLCQFLDAESQLIPTEAIEAAVSGRATIALPGAWRPATAWLGTDVGRKRDLTVHALIEQLGDQFVVRALDCQARATFAAQKARIKELLPLVRRHCMDATGLGMQQAEELHREYPAKCEAVDFGKGDVKSAIALGLKRKFEDRRIEIPDDRDLKTDLKSVKRLITEAGNVRYDARRSDAGHADRFWALALAIHASERLSHPLTEGVLGGEGVVSGDDIERVAIGGAEPKPWWRPDHAGDQRQRFGGSL